METRKIKMFCFGCNKEIPAPPFGLLSIIPPIVVHPDNEVCYNKAMERYGISRAVLA